MACALLGALGLPGAARAERKRVVVLELDGPRKDRFHADLVRLLKKAHTVVPTAKWNATAEKLDATELSERSLKRVARKLKVDAIVEGKIEKRRDEFLIRLKLREGRSGALVGSTVDTKAVGPRISGQAQRDIQDELFGLIASIESNRRAGADDEDEVEVEDVRKGKQANDKDAAAARKGKQVDDEDAPVVRKGKKADDEDVAARKRSKDSEEGDDPLQQGAGNRDAGAEDRRGSRRVAASDEGPSGEAEPGSGPVPGQDVKLSPGERALDAVAGLSVTARRLTFSVRTGLMDAPPSYKGSPVAGGMLDATIYPLALGHERGDLLKNLGLSVLYDRVFTVTTKDAMGRIYDSKETRLGIGVVLRFPFGRSATSPVVIGSLGYASQVFSIASGTQIGIPSVSYSIIEPGAGLRVPVTPRLCAALDARLMLFTGTGQIQDQDQYGAASVLGFEGSAGLDYRFTRNLFARAALRFETIGFTFKGNGMLSNARDGDPMTQDVAGARDSYLGGMATVGYLY